MKPARILGHPLHPILTDAPIALLGTSLVWDALGLWRGDAIWWAIAFWNIVAGLVAAAPALATGLWDYAALPEDSPAAKTALWHMMVMMTAASVYGASLAVRAGSAPPVGLARWGAPALELGGLVLLVVGGWFGGELVFRHGVAVGRSNESAGPAEASGEPSSRR